MATTNKVTNFTVTNGTVVEVQDPHAVTLDENIDVQGTFDFDKITGAGNYNVPINALNAPSGISVTTGTLKVLYDHDKPVQVYIHRVTNQVFVRSLGDNGSWSSWVELTSVTSLQSQLNTLTSNLSTEKTARAQADTTLQNNINTVTSNLTKETNARTNAIDSLNTKVTSITVAQSEQAESIRSLNSSVESLNSAFEWKLLKKVTGQTHVTLPSNWNELYIGINIVGSIYYAFYVPKIFATNEKNIYVVNTYPTDSNGYCNISITATDYYLKSCTSETTNVNNSATSYIYYR